LTVFEGRERRETLDSFDFTVKEGKANQTQPQPWATELEHGMLESESAFGTRTGTACIPFATEPDPIYSGTYQDPYSETQDWTKESCRTELLHLLELGKAANVLFLNLWILEQGKQEDDSWLLSGKQRKMNETEPLTSPFPIFPELIELG